MTGTAAVTRVVGLCLLVIVGGCSDGDAPTTTAYQPAALSSVAGDATVKQVTLTEEASRRIGLRTTVVRTDGDLLVVASGAVIYDPNGRAFVYTAISPLTFVRAPVNIVKGNAQQVWASGGPPAGTQVVTTGTAEVYGAEFEVGH